jgi:phospholipase/carboxylesterase
MHPQNFDFKFEEKGSIKRILLTTGANDTMIIPGDIVRLKQELQRVFLDVSLEITDGGHGVDDEEVATIRKWYKAN